MSSKVAPIPAGYRTITPYMIVDNAAKAIEFYKQAFGASEIMRANHEGKVAHAELKFGDSIVMLADENTEKGCFSPKSTKGSPVSLLIYIEDVDAIVKRAVAAGAKLTRPVETMFYGDRTGTVMDPFGHQWTISTHVEDVSEEELRARMEKLFATSK